jgi:hypothetical protein
MDVGLITSNFDDHTPILLRDHRVYQGPQGIGGAALFTDNLAGLPGARAYF